MTQVPQNNYLALPKSGTGAGVLVLHAWWGLNDFFKDFCKRLVGVGFVALAPDLYHGNIATTNEEAKQLRSKLKREQVSADILSAVEQLQDWFKSNGYLLYALQRRGVRHIENLEEYADRINPHHYFDILAAQEINWHDKYKNA